MPLITAIFAEKIRKLRGTIVIATTSQATGISESRLVELESGNTEPTGDEVLILAEHFRREFEYLISDALEDPDENVIQLFRSEGTGLTPEDHAAIREFMFLCKNEEYLESLVGSRHSRTVDDFQFAPSGNYFKGHGQQCALEFRNWLGLRRGQVVHDIYGLLRSVGFRLFRRPLPTKNISALYIRHPVAGHCVLVNLKEDYNRQRFSAAHECGHALMDKNSSFNVTRDYDIEIESPSAGTGKWSNRELVEIRANAFATDFLIPNEYLTSEKLRGRWEEPEQLVQSADDLHVTLPALMKALLDKNIISSESRSQLRSLNMRPRDREDPELPDTLTDSQFERRNSLISKGLSVSYIQLCFDAYGQDLISRGKLADCLLTDLWELKQIAKDFGRSLAYE